MAIRSNIFRTYPKIGGYKVSRGFCAGPCNHPCTSLDSWLTIKVFFEKSFSGKGSCGVILDGIFELRVQILNVIDCFVY